jgi:diguanylate cyclase (GGDEF)-like protein
VQRRLGVIHTRIMASLSCNILVYFSILGTILIAMVIALWQLSQTFEPLSEIHKRRLESYKLAEELRRSSDELTGMVCTYAVMGDERYSLPCTLLLLDIDLFKSINDQQGHLIGDQVLIAVAESPNNSIRSTDVAGLWGGEAFLVICPETDVEKGYVVAEKIRTCIMEHAYTRGVSITISGGIAPLMLGETTDTTLERADRALCSAKRNGRNQVCCDAP